MGGGGGERARRLVSPLAPCTPTHSPTTLPLPPAPPPPQLFIFVLCQASLRQLISKALGLGLPPDMADITPTVPKGVKKMFGLDEKDK